MGNIFDSTQKLRVIEKIFSFVLTGLLLSMFIVQNFAAEVFYRRQLSLNSNLNFSSDTDLSNKTWIEAFDALHIQMSREYPFTEWKGIDWSSLYTKFKPRIALAQASKDEKAYYLALREYVYSIPDGHVRIRGDDPKQMLAHLIGGGYGFAITGLDNNRIIAHIILPDGAANRAGIKFSAEIIKWNGQSVERALEQVPLWFDDKPPATRESRRLTQYRYLVRAPVGHKTTVTFKNPGQTKPQTVTLTAFDDNLETLTRTNFYVTAEERKVPVQYKILPSGYGYIKIVTFPSPHIAPLVEQLKEAIQTFVDKKVPAIILDLRRNGGGDDEVTAKVAGFFYSQRQFYYSAAFYNKNSKQFEVNPKEKFWIEPQTQYYPGTVAAMISNGTVSNGEGLADAVQKLPSGYVVGYYGTNGAYGSTGGQVKMPKGYLVLYPVGRGVDLDGRILLESDEKGLGGVSPDFRIPRTAENIYAALIENKDIELEFTIRMLQERQK